jgi:SPX domain protein involved in polyphosphate accumulation
MRKDAHTIDGKYKIRSLYFDNLWDKALREKIDGVNKREKFRIRYYNDDISVIHLEKKSKCSGLGSKQRDAISAEEAQAIVDGKYDWMIECKDRPLVQELYSKIMSEGLKPKAIVDYDREPFIYDAGHVRVTLDYNIRTGLHCTDFLNPNCITVPAGDNSTIILEVKWDNFLPTIIRSIVQLENRSASAYSKYASCRIYG